MARKKNVLPSYLLHKSSGQARVRIGGHDHLLGLYGSDESRIKDSALVARTASGLPVDPFGGGSNSGTLPRNEFEADSGPSVNEVCIAFWRHAEKHYVKNGEPTSEIFCYRSCLRVLCELYGVIPVKDFGPLALKAVRAKLVSGDSHAKNSAGELTPRQPWSRTSVNAGMSRIRRVFKYAVENEMIDVTVLTRLQAVAPLLSGRTEAHDNAPRHAIDQDKIDAVRQLVRPLVRDLWYET